MNSDGWPPNGCAKCGQPERGHPGGDYAYVPPSDALRLARMRARREARLNPPARAETPPDLITTLTADAGDWEDASRYLLHQLHQQRDHQLRRTSESMSERYAALLDQAGCRAPVQAISTPGPHEPGIYTVRPDAGHPARMRIGDGEWAPCRVVGFDMAPSGDGTMVTGEVDEDGRFHLEVERIYQFQIEFTAACENLAGFTPVLASAGEAMRALAARLDPELEAARHWEAQGRVCCHVCGPDPGHVCDAKAVTTLRHPLPSGGVRDLPLCGPCNLAEADAPSVPN